MLVGVLFAVYGQIYQTGANAYDFFLAWTVFVTLWVVVSNFAPLWLIYIALANTTFILYSQQVADWSGVFVFTSLFIINTIVLIASILLAKHNKTRTAPDWFLKIIALSCATYATLGMISGIFGDFKIAFLVLILMAAIALTAGIWYGLKTKSGFYLSVISFSLIVIVSAWLIEISERFFYNGAGMFLVMSLFIIASVTLTVKILINLQKNGKILF